MKRPIKAVIFSLTVVALTGLAAYGAVRLSDQLSSANTQNCSQKGADHLVVIKDGTVSPGDTTGKVCDTLTIKNEDDVTRFMAFGQHDNHQAYDGISERTLTKDQSFTIIMNKAGEFLFHDHLHDEVRGTFTAQ